jgi:hypothetical protein
LETYEEYLALGNERFEACGALFIRNRKTPSRYDANTIALIRDASRIDELLKRAEIEYAHLEYRQFHIDPLTPPKVEARLSLAGFARWSAHLVMVLEGELNAAPRTVAIQEVVGDDNWKIYRELQDLEHEEYRQRLGRPPSPSTDEFLQYVRAKSPPARAWLALERTVSHTPTALRGPETTALEWLKTCSRIPISGVGVWPLPSSLIA